MTSIPWWISYFIVKAAAGLINTWRFIKEEVFLSVSICVLSTQLAGEDPDIHGSMGVRSEAPGRCVC